ncbi:cupin domain-containing protein [Algoriphagus terrigena]|uniref:cupin domain-containing protein n=1 Tax=Algoriphagus terrigena TaxID=344884 RepID=UPI000416E75F|nr:cupin domain-containing protein [Algoriphagus terrigena]
MKRRKFILTTAALAAYGSDLMAAPNNETDEKDGFLVKSGEARHGIHTPFMGVNPNDLKISTKDTAGQLSVFEYTGVEKTGPPLHVHLEQDEVFYVVEGDFLFQLGDKRYSLSGGDTIFLPRNIPHTWLQISDRGKLLYILQPAIRMEEFFYAMNDLGRPPSEEEAQKISLAHGIKNVGPPITLVTM